MSEPITEYDIVSPEDLGPPTFEFKDFTQTKKPYEYVAKARDDDFEFMQRQEVVAKNAIAVGIKNFKTLMRKYMERHYPKKRSIYVNSTEFTDQPMELNSGSYFCNDSGISIDDDRDFNVEVCNHPIMPIQRLVNIDDNTEKLKIAYRKGSYWREIIVDKEILASSNKILALAKYGIAVNSENSKYLVKFFTDIENLNFDVIQELKSVGRLGWVAKDRFSPYVDDLVFDGNENFKNFFQSVHAQGKYKTWVDLCKNIRKSPKSKIARIMLAASFASVLVEVCDCLPFFVHLWGGTEAGKTVGLMLAASVWANPSIGDYIHTFNSTSVAQELSASFVNSLPLIIDELQIVKDKKNFDNMIYLLSEGVGRARGQKTGGLQKVGTWRNCIITNGEFPISSSASGAGAVNRIIEIGCDDVKIFDEPIEVVNIIKRNFGGAGRLFIGYLQMDDVQDEVRDRQKELYKELICNSDTTEKQAISASLILLADEIIERIIFEDCIRLTKDDIQPYLSTKAQVNQNERCLDFIYDYIAVNSNKFYNNHSEREYNGEIWGELDNDYVYIIKTIFDKILTDNGYNSRAFLTWANNKLLLETDTDRSRFSKKKRICGTPCNCVALKRKPEQSFALSEYEDEDLPFD